MPCEDKVLERILIEPNMKSDTVHPNHLGYKTMAEAVARLLKKAAGGGLAAISSALNSRRAVDKNRFLLYAYSPPQAN